MNDKTKIKTFVFFVYLLLFVASAILTLYDCAATPDMSTLLWLVPMGIGVWGMNKTRDFGEDEDEEVKQRLRDLGYVD